MLLGRQVAGPEHYSPELLFPIPRARGRQDLGIEEGVLPFYGEDVWHAYELSWLEPDGRPTLYLGRLQVPANSPNLVESKSLKLYLNSLNNTAFDSAEQVIDTVTNDLSKVIGAEVGFSLLTTDDASFNGVAQSGQCIDAEVLPASPWGEQCLAARSEENTSETLFSHLLRSLCPVTGQPDWATVWIDYSGPKIDRGGLLAYLLSFRSHQEFHEQCVERMYQQIWASCNPSRLQVQALYTRRGGLDICPWRSSESGRAPTWRMNRQ